MRNNARTYGDSSVNSGDQMRDMKILCVGNEILLVLVTLLVNMTFLVSCDSKPSHQAEKAWQHSFREALVDGYSDFKGLFVDTDNAVYMFSYKLPPRMETSSVISVLRRQNNAYSVISESKNELVLRRSEKSTEFHAFDEYRFSIDEQYGVTVMFASIDSPAELKNFPFYIEKYNEYRRHHSKRVDHSGTVGGHL